MFTKKEKIAVLFGWILCFLAGYIEIYSLKVRGVFAVMQTGNLITLFTSLIDKDYSLALGRLAMVLIFVIGLILSMILKNILEKKGKRTEIYFLILEIITLIPPVFIPVGSNSFWIDFSANSFFALFGAFQLAGFTSLNGKSFVSTMMTGVLRNTVFYFVKSINSKDKKDILFGFFYLGMLFFFIGGIVSNYFLLTLFEGNNTWIQLVPIFVIPLLLINIVLAYHCYGFKIENGEE